MRERVCMLEPRVGPLPLSASAMRASLFCPLQIALTNCSECETSKLEVSYKKHVGMPPEVHFPSSPMISSQKCSTAPPLAGGVSDNYKKGSLKCR